MIGNKHTRLLGRLRAAAKLLGALSLVMGSASAGPISLTPGFNLSGKLNYVTTGASFRTTAGNTNPCSLKSVSASNDYYSVTNNAVSAARTTASTVPTGATIEKALLYWTASTHETGYNLTSIRDTSVKFYNAASAAPAGDNVTASKVISGAVRVSSYDAESMVAIADVTSIISAAPNAQYRMDGLTVFNATGSDTCNTAIMHANWALYIVYSLPTESTKTIQFWDGIEHVGGTSGQASTTVTLSGLKVPNAAPGTEKIAKTTILASDGDPGSTGDTLRLHTDRDAEFNALNSLNGQNDIFNSSVTGGPAAATTPAATGDTAAGSVGGLDFDTFDLSNQVSAGTSSITATVDSAAGERVIIYNMVLMATSTVADVSVQKSGPTSQVGAGNITYTLNVRNNGPDEAYNVAVSDPLPAGMTYVSSTSGGTYSAGTRTVSWTLGKLNSGDTRTLTVTVSVPAGDNRYTNTASVTSGISDSNTSNNTSSVTTVASIANGPRMTPDTGSVYQNTASTNPKNAVTVNVLANDTGGTTPQASSVVFPTTGQPTGSTVTNAGKTLANAEGIYQANTDGTVTFTPANAASIGARQAVTYQVSDAGGLNGTTTLTITVLNLAPAASSATNTTLLNSAPATSLSPGLSGSDPDGTVATYRITTLPAAASGVLALNGVAVTPNQPIPTASVAGLTFDPAAGFTGTATFTYIVSDNNGATSSAATYSIPIGVTPLACTNTMYGLFAGPRATYTIWNIPDNNTYRSVASLTPTGSVGTADAIVPQAASLGNNQHTAMAISRDGTKIFVAGQAEGMYVYSLGEGWTKVSYAGLSVNSNPVRMAITPDGNGYFSTGDQLWRFQTTAPYTITGPFTVIVQGTAGVTNPVPSIVGASGDFFSDSEGNLYLISNQSGQASLDIFKIKPSGSTPTATFFGRIVSPLISTTTTYAGIAALGDDIYISGPSGQILKLNMASLAVTEAAPAASGRDSTDLASCSFPRLAPAITSTKTVAKVAGSGGAFVTTGDTLEYTIQIRNTGTLNAAGVTLQDSVPVGTTYVAGSTTLNGAAVPDSSGMPFTTAALVNSPGEAAGVVRVNNSSDAFVATVKFRVQVNAGVDAVSNQGVVTYVDAPAPVNTDNPATTAPLDATVTTITRADLVVTKSDGVESVLANGRSTYTIRVTNNGPSSVAGATLTDTPGAGLTLSGAACTAATGNTCTTSPTALTLPLPTLNAGQFYEVTVVGTNALTGGTVTNTAGVTLPGGMADPVPGNNTVSDANSVTPQADLQVTKVATRGVAGPGESVTYTVTVRNLGPSPAVNVVVTDTLPEYVQLTSAAPAATVTGQTLTWAAGSLAPNGSLTYSVSVSMPSQATLKTTPDARIQTNLAKVQSDTVDQEPGNNQATATTGLLYVVLTKKVRNVTRGGDFGVEAQGTPGDVLEYCMAYANYGGLPVTNFRIMDDVPDNTNVLLNAYDQEAASAGTGYGVKWNSRTAVYFTSANDGDLASLTGEGTGAFSRGYLLVSLGEVGSGSAGTVCFRASIR